MQRRLFVFFVHFTCVFACFCPSAFADDFTLNNKALFLSEYYTRGSSQTKELPALQLLSVLSHESGVYAGFFISRVEFQDNDQADQEIDLAFGYNKNINDFYYRTGLIYYVFPDADSSLNYNFWELDLALGYNFNPLYSELILKTSPNHFASSGHSRYVKFENHLPVSEQLKFKGHIAHRHISDNAALGGLPDNFEWELGLEYKPLPEHYILEGLEFILKYVDSSFSKSECPYSGWCDERIITGIAYNF